MIFTTRQARMGSITFAPTRQFARANAAATKLVAAIEPAFDFVGIEYLALWQRSRSTAFQGARWLSALQRDVAPAAGAEPVTVTVRDANDGRLMLVLPLARRRALGVVFLTFADFGLCDYLGPVYDPAYAQSLLADANLPQRVAAALPPHDVLQFTKLVAGDAVLERLFPETYRARMRVSAYPVKIHSTWKEWRMT